MTKIKEDGYAFPCAIIRANEKKVLSADDLGKVLDARNVSGALGVLGEFGYGDGKEPANPRDFEKILRAHLADVYQLVFSVIPEPEELKMFLYPNDYHNAKVVIKSEFLGTDPAPYLVETGDIPGEKLAALIKERNFVFLSLEMKHAVEEALDMFARGRDPQEIDIILDKACYRDMLASALGTENDFIIDYVKLLIDILNVNTFIRLREIGKSPAFFTKVFLEGGAIDEKVFSSAFEEGYQQLADKMAPYGFREVFAAGAMTVASTKKYTLLEKLCDDMKMKYMKDAHYVSFGIEPVLAYLVAKESEVKNLRVILTGKLAGTDNQVIKERLRETYV